MLIYRQYTANLFCNLWYWSSNKDIWGRRVKISYTYKGQKVKHGDLKYPDYAKEIHPDRAKDLLKKDIDSLQTSIKKHIKKKGDYEFCKVLIVASRYNTPKVKERNFKVTKETDTPGRPANSENIEGEDFSPHFHLLVTAKPLYPLTERIRGHWKNKFKVEGAKVNFRNVKSAGHLNNLLTGKNSYFMAQKLFYRTIGLSEKPFEFLYIDFIDK